MPWVKVNRIQFLILAQIICFNETLFEVLQKVVKQVVAVFGETAAALLPEAYRVIKPLNRERKSGGGRD